MRLYRSAAVEKKLKCIEMVNSMAILAKLFPVLYMVQESQALDQCFSSLLFWQGTIPGDKPGSLADELEIMNGGGEDVIGAPFDQSGPLSPVKNEEWPFEPLLDHLNLGRPFGAFFFDTLLALFFLPSFTLSELKGSAKESLPSLPLAYVWEPGLLVEEAMPSTWAHYNNRIAVMQCLLEVMREPQNQEESTAKSAWWDYFCTRPNPYAKMLFISLFNVVLSELPRGWNLNYWPSKKKQLAELSISLLNMMLVYKHPKSSEERDEHSELTDFSSKENYFVRLLSQLSSNDYDFLLNNFCRILSIDGLARFEERLILFLQVILLNTSFFNYALKQDKMIEIVDPLVSFLHHANCHSDLSRLIFSLLLILSGSRDFAISLNKQVQKKHSLLLSRGSYADLLILGLLQGASQIVVEDLIMPLTIIFNISAYLKNLVLSTITELLNVFELVSRTEWLLQHENNHRCLFFILEIFNNILQYQYETNTSFAYLLLRYKDSFYKLADLPKTLEQMIAGEVKGAESPSHVPEDNQPSQPAPEYPPIYNALCAQDSPYVEHSTFESPSSSKSTRSSSFRWTYQTLPDWATHLPISTILSFLNGVLPQINEMLDGTYSDHDKILSFLKRTTLVGILPVPHPIAIVLFKSSPNFETWVLHRCQSHLKSPSALY
ncbi:protein HID1-like isoform X1 [Schistocerca gregaria]|uniref:protein HID1-like isoform X1 n=1 Tax=Schistocerca gregaria TaxID=7010 RepID=UPI00211E8D04|nr:protein HID1-like isoform X1 [Schistocerca gregaria]